MPKVFKEVLTALHHHPPERLQNTLVHPNTIECGNKTQAIESNTIKASNAEEIKLIQVAVEIFSTLR